MRGKREVDKGGKGRWIDGGKERMEEGKERGKRKMDMQEEGERVREKERR